jgi:hypothetical protein
MFQMRRMRQGLLNFDLSLTKGVAGKIFHVRHQPVGVSEANRDTGLVTAASATV